MQILKYNRQEYILLHFCNLKLVKMKLLHRRVLFGLIGLYAIGLGCAAPSTFDFIVVGGGTAGCTVASRLSESGEYSVLLLEAGGYPDPGMEVPALALNYIGNPKYSKVFQMVQQENAALEMGGYAKYIIGRVLGGSSSINGIVFNRGHPNDYKLWAEKTGDQSWSYPSMLNYFKKSESYRGNYPSESQHGFDGPISVGFTRYAPQLETLYEAGQYLGYPIADPNGPQKSSFAPSEMSLKRGRRVSSFAGYLKNVVDKRNNLKIVVNAFAKKIIFEGNKAVGVVYSPGFNPETGKGSEEFVTVRANKEIILSCGTLESPTLLMRSGVGPKDVLKESGISKVKDLQGVGKNLHDHALVRMEFRINDDTDTHIRKRDVTPQAYALYNQTGDGPYSTIDGIFVQSFMISSKAKESEGSNTWPDIHVQFFSGPGTNLSKAGPDAPGKVSLITNLFLSRPRGSGSIKLNSTHPDSDPLIDFDYFANPEDMEVMVEGAKKVVEVYEKTPAFQKLGGRYFPPPLPACEGFVPKSDEYFKCFIKQKCISGLHGVGTCAMGKAKDKNAVVDPTLRVIGIKGLRVVDGSILPRVTNANLQAPIYGIAEKASEMILKSWDKNGRNESFV